MDKAALISYLERLDRALQSPATLYIYGSAACILMDEPERTSLGIDVAAPYSIADFGAFRQAAETAGIPINPPDPYQGDHIEWIQALRLCMPRPDTQSEIILWQGAQLSIKTLPPPQLIASKLIRYDEIDQGDIRYLLSQRRTTFSEIESAIQTLPPPFNVDPIVLDNLHNLEADMKLWKVSPHD